MRHVLFIIALTASYSSSLHADAIDVERAIPENCAEFLQKATLNAQKSSERATTANNGTVIEVGQVAFVPVEQLWAGQREVSAENARTKLFSSAADYGLDRNGDSWALPNDGGRSLLEISDPLLVVRFKNRYVIVDGHHHAVMNAFVGGRTAAVKVLYDFSSLTESQLWQELLAKRLVHLPGESVESIMQNRPSLASLRDNPNRYLASILGAKVDLSFQSERVRVNGVRATNDALWVKINDGVPFVEFMIAEVLTRAGINYDPDWGDNVPREIVNKSRAALLQARERGDFPELDSIILLESKKQAKKIGKDEDALADLVRDFLTGHGISCSILNRQYAEAWASRAK